jgi:di/tricarboxylate transporter
LILLAVILVVTLVLLVTQWIRIELTALVLIAMLGLSGTLSPADALAGFSNPAMLTVAAMLVLSAGLERAGVVDYVGKAIARRASRGTTVLLLFLAVPTAVFSAFMNNTAIVALMIPVALTMARLRRLPASKLLLPISYLSILAGTCTLIGTSTNILVDSLYRQAGGPGFGMFEFSALGVVYLAVGGAYVVLFLPRLLPKRTSLGMDPKPLLIAISFGASASFATPIGYQTNTMVMGPGGYLFRDYLRAGLPLNIVMAIVATVLIPLFWPP